MAGLTPTLVAGRRWRHLRVTHTLVAGRRWRRLTLPPTLVAGRSWRYLRLTLDPCCGMALAAFKTNTLVVGWCWPPFRVTNTILTRRCRRRLRLTPTLVAGRRWLYLRFKIYPCGDTALAAFETYSLSCGRTAWRHLGVTHTLVAGRRLTLTPTRMTGWRWRHLMFTLYACGGTALAAFETNTSCGWTALNI